MDPFPNSRPGGALEATCRCLASWEYNNSYSPTSRFAAVRTVIATAAQEGMELYHWDIQGAFCTSNVDKEIFMQPPTGYSLPPGKCLRLRKSLDGLRQSSTLFFENLERWMLDYRFQPIRPDSVMFRLDSEGQKLIVSLYVDNRVCTQACDSLYPSLRLFSR
eukprot:3180229-Rhodomonas_salina.1